MAQIESVLAPLGATVVSPDRVLDRITGSMREVDASIRYRMGDSIVLVTVECRDRQKTEDTMWIEQLVTKQHSIGAAKTIAVTSRKFSEPALRKAAHFGVDARVLRDVRPEEFSTLLKMRYEELSYQSVLIHLGIAIHAEQGDNDVPVLAPETLDQLRKAPSEARVFRLRSGENASWNDQYKTAQRDHHKALYDGVPLDGSSLRKNLKLEFSEDLYIDTVRGRRRVRSLDSVVEICVRRDSSAMLVKRTSAYSNASAILAHAATYTAQGILTDLSVTSVAPVDGQAVLAFQLRPKRDT